MGHWAWGIKHSISSTKLCFFCVLWAIVTGEDGYLKSIIANIKTSQT
ncbi:hypothetical protein [aff. Roholtiella sp. LEGE 12411]|nr:hypothetical protein [aff. Roholtiella sp. LEGE 12411]